MLAEVPADIQQEVDLEVAISNRINDLIQKRGLSKQEFAQAWASALRGDQVGQQPAQRNV